VSCEEAQPLKAGIYRIANIVRKMQPCVMVDPHTELCWVCGKPVNEADRLRDEFGFVCHATCESAESEAARLDAAKLDAAKPKTKSKSV
jgi:predicted nucleic acid-binding Zn ribbon protein